MHLFSSSTMCKKCVADYYAGKDWNSIISTSSEVYALFTLYSFGFFTIQTSSSTSVLRQGLGQTERLPSTQATRDQRPLFYLDELADSILGELDYSQLTELPWCCCSGSRFQNANSFLSSASNVPFLAYTKVSHRRMLFFSMCISSLNPKM